MSKNVDLIMKNDFWKVLRISTVCYNWPMSAHASQAFSIAHCTNSEDLPDFDINHSRTCITNCR